MALPNNVNLAYPGKTASASNYNNLIDNVGTLDNAIAAVADDDQAFAAYMDSQDAQHASFDSRLSALESGTPMLDRSGGTWVSTGSPPTLEGSFIWSYWDSTAIDGPVDIALESNNTDFTVQRAGVWVVDTTLQITGTAGGTGFYVFVENSDGSSAWAKSGGPVKTVNVRFARRFAKGEQFRVAGYLSRSGDPNQFNYNPPPMMHAYRIGA